MDLLGVGSLPFLSRRNYYHEVQHLVLWSTLTGVIEGQLGSVVVARTFHGTPLMIAIAAATPVAALSSSLLWGMLCVGRRKLPLLAYFAAGTALCAGVVGAIPTSSAGAVWFICQMAAAQVLLAGVVTVRSAVWKSNYPHAARGRITAKLQGVRIVVSNVTVLIVARICDLEPESYRYIFPCAAVLGLLSVGLLTRLHIRGERSELRHRNRRAGNGDLPTGLVEPFSVTALLSPGHVFRKMYDVLRGDRRFRQYCFAQLFSGTANLLMIAVVVAIVTRELDIGDEWGFWVAMGLTQAVQRLVMLVSLRRWARLFDRIGVVRFRAVNGVCWTMAIVCGLAATYIISGEVMAGSVLPVAVGLFSLRAVFQGLGLGGAVLAWHLGHLHFARKEDAEIYMGIHVSLTGLRGLIAPLAGMWLWSTIGWPVWLVALAFSLISLALYARMARLETSPGAIEANA